MVSVKVKFRPSVPENLEGTIYYQIILERKSRQLKTDYHVFSSEWDERRSKVINSNNNERKSLIMSIRENIRRDIERLTKIVKRLDNTGIDYSVQDVIDEFLRYEKEYSLFSFMENIIINLKLNGKSRTAETYTATLNSFKKFRKGKDLILDNLSSDIMEAYQAWHQQRGVMLNTISFYIRVLRAVYNRAVEDEIIENRNPFRHVYTGVDKTVKRAISLEAISNIKKLDLTVTPCLDFARDMFIMSFMLRGMSFVDMAYLRKTDLHNGYITYRRRKTGQQLKIAWTDDMQKLLSKYPENRSQYLLPIITNVGRNDRSTYRNAGYNINRNLKTIGKRVGITIPLTLYVARHSWASAAKAKGIPLTVISEGLGHDSEATTQIYLSSLDTSRIDQANSLILRSL